MEQTPTILSQEVYSGLRNYIFSKVKENAIADDLTQEVYLKVHKNINQLQDSEKMNAWIYRIARNAIIDFYRNEKKQREKLQDFSLEFYENEEHELLKCVQPMITELPEKYKIALQQCDLEGVSQKELAEQMKISHSAAKSRVQRGRKLLKNLLLECCVSNFTKRYEKCSDENAENYK